MEGRELPVGWVVAPISELAIKVGSGATPKGGQSAYQASGIPLIRSMNVVFFGFKKEGLAYINEDQARRLSNAEVRQGDVLLNITGASIGRVASAPSWSEGARVNQHVCIIRPSEFLIQDYLSAYLSSPSIQSFILDENYGVTRQALTKQQVLALEVPVPPLNEQRRIAAKLDTTLAAVDACRQRLDGVAAILKRFRQAVLAAATSGELTREWREERELGHEPFKKHSLRGLVQESLSNGKSVRDGEGDYVLRLSCLKSDSVDWRESKQGNWEGIAVERFLIHQGDFLIARGNGSKSLVGRGCLVNEPPPRMAFPDTMIRIRPDQSKIHPVYLSIAWEHRSTRDQIESSARTSAGILKASQSDLEVIQLSIPGQYEKQVEIVRRAQGLITLADQLEARLNAARKDVDRLTPALLAKAFRGEMVPQDPSDEPASVLLERIRAARQAEAGAGKPSQRGRPRAAASRAPINRNAATAPSKPLPPDLLTQLLRECGALSERALLAVSELEPEWFEQQLFRELARGTAREVQANGQRLLEAVG